MRTNSSNPIQRENDQEIKNILNPILGTLSLLIALPLFIALHRFAPNPNWSFQLDRILLALFTAALVFLIFKKFKSLVLAGFLATLIGLTYGQFTNRYCFDNLYEDYRAMIYSLKDTPHPDEFIATNFVPFPHKSSFLKGIDYKNAAVRNFALSTTTKHFVDYQRRKKYRIIIQSFAIFKEINSNWNYVNDPKSREYIAKASESIKHLAGDCDDHSILMAAAIKSIGGTPRLIYTKQHVYPEILIGNLTDLESLNYLIREKLFKYDIGDERLYYHEDQYRQIWLNLDYTAANPGGKFLQEEVLGVLNL